MTIRCTCRPGRSEPTCPLAVMGEKHKPGRDLEPNEAARWTVLGGRTLREALAHREKTVIVEILAVCGQSRVEAAAALGISREALYLKMKKHGLLPGPAL